MALEARPKPVETLARAAGRIAAGGDLRTAVGALAAAVAEAVEAELVVIRVAEQGELVARAAAPAGSTLAAEVIGTRAAVEAIEAAIPSDVVERVALTAGAEGVIVEPARA